MTELVSCAVAPKLFDRTMGIEGLKRGRPLDRPGAGQRAIPFIAIAVLAFAAVPLLHRANMAQYVIAAAAVVPIVLAGSLLPWERLPAAAQAVPPLLYFVVVAFMRDAQGGANSAFSTLLMLPVAWFALYGTGRQLGVAVAALAATVAAPIFVVGGERYPDTEWVRLFLWVLIAGGVGMAVHRLVVSRERLTEQVTTLARTDELTGFATRRAWEEELESELARSDRQGYPVSVALLDLDRFREFNERHGHQSGDRLLKEAAARWRAIVRRGDLLGRYAGQRFAVLLPGTDLNTAARVVRRMRLAVPGEVTASCGMATAKADEPGHALLARTARMLESAKERGGDQTLASGLPF